MLGSEGKGARPGMLRGGRDTRGGTEEAEGRKRKHFSASEFGHMVPDQKIKAFTC